jgi:hypothetical protein
MLSLASSLASNQCDSRVSLVCSGLLWGVIAYVSVAGLTPPARFCEAGREGNVTGLCPFVF